ncbi:MAG: ParA family protein [Planctomycetales bacterium]|nr:ParA family protein [Planctomycetales bacterium]
MIIGIANAKGGVGKTTVAVHLTSWLNEHRWKACLVDSDFQCLSSRWLESANPTIPTYVINSPEQIVIELSNLSGQFDAVVVDAPGGLGEITGAILSQADALLIPTGPSNLDILALDWATSTVHEVQRLRNGLPQTAIIPVQADPRRLTTRNLIAKARGLGFGVTQSVVPYREIYAQAAGLANRPPSLLWQLGTSRRVRQASLELDSLFQEVFPEACEDDPNRIAKLVSRNRKTKQTENNNDQKLAANS